MSVVQWGIVVKHYQAGRPSEARPGQGGRLLMNLSPQHIIHQDRLAVSLQSVTECAPAGSQVVLVILDYNVLLTEMLNPNLAATDPILLF